MSAQDMTNALNHFHPDVPLFKILDDTITALTSLAAIFAKKLKNPPVQATTTAPKATEVKHPEALVQPLLMSLVKHKHQTRLQTKNNTSDLDNVIEYQNSPQPPGVVTLATIGAEPLRFPERERNLSPRNLFHADFLDKVSANQAISLGKKHWTNMQIMNAVLYISTGK